MADFTKTYSEKIKAIAIESEEETRRKNIIDVLSRAALARDTAWAAQYMNSVSRSLTSKET